MSKSEQSPRTWRDRLRAAINRTGRPHGEIARKAGVTPETLSHILTGRSVRPACDTVRRIAHAAGETVGAILGEHGYQLTQEQRDQLRRAAHLIENVTRE